MGYTCYNGCTYSGNLSEVDTLWTLFLGSIILLWFLLCTAIRIQNNMPKHCSQQLAVTLHLLVLPRAVDPLDVPVASFEFIGNVVKEC